jgi:hypothetical protein
MTSPHPTGHAVGVGSILVGMGLFLLGRSFDGFWFGLLTGACVATILIGVVLVSSAWRQGGSWLPTREDDDGYWLPSRDEEER